MGIIITVFKSQFTGHSELSKKLQEMATDYTTLEDAFIFAAPPGQVVKFVNLLTKNGIAYSIQTEGKED